MDMLEAGEVENYALSLLKSMLKIYSPTGHEDRLANFLHNELKKLGFDVAIDAVGNVVGTIGKGPSVLMCGHMDTVEGEIPVEVKDNMMYGRGSVDAKASLASMIVATKLFNQSEGGLKVVLAAVVDEEGYSKGIKHLTSYLEKPSYAFFGEPSNTSGITIGYKGSLTIEILVKTRTGHPASSPLFTNAIELAYNIWLKIKEETSRRAKPESIFQSLDAALMHMASARKLGILPDECLLSINLRLPPRMSCSEAASLVSNCVNEVVPKPSASVKVEFIDCIEAFEDPPTSPVARALQRAIIKILGRRPMFLKKTGTSDINILRSLWNIPSVAYGPGDPKLDHTPEERVSIEDFLASIKVYAQALRELKAIHQASAQHSSR